MLIFNVTVWVILFLLVAIRFVRCIRLVPTQKEYIVERLGRYHRTLGAGFHILVPFFDRVAFIQDLKEESIEVPPQECFTKDNVKVEVDGVIYMSVVNSKAASYGIINYRYAAVQLAQTTTRSVIGTLELDRTFEERDAINSRVVSVLGEVSDTWGIRVHRYEVKNIVPPTTVRDAMERQMAAERERRAILARAEGEKQARINKSEGRMAEMINRSEGEQQRRINEAEGHAEEILTVARATAESITKLAGAIAAPGGLDATRLRLCQQYLERLGSLARESTAVLLPADLTRLDTLLESLAFGKLANRIFPAVSSPPPSERGERLQPPLAAAAAPFASGTPDLSPKGPETEPPPVVAQVLEPQLTSPRASGVPRVVSEVPLAFGAKTAGQPAPAEILERRSFEPTPVTQPPIAPAPTAPQPAVTAPVVPRAPTAPQPAVTAPVVPRAPTAPQPAVTAPVVPRAPTAPQPAVTAPVVPRAPTAPQPAVTAPVVPRAPTAPQPAVTAPVVLPAQAAQQPEAEAPVVPPAQAAQPPEAEAPVVSQQPVLAEGTIRRSAQPTPTAQPAVAVPSPARPTPAVVPPPAPERPVPAGKSEGEGVVPPLPVGQAAVGESAVPQPAMAQPGASGQAAPVGLVTRSDRRSPQPTPLAHPPAVMATDVSSQWTAAPSAPLVGPSAEGAPISSIASDVEGMAAQEQPEEEVSSPSGAMPEEIGPVGFESLEPIPEQPASGKVSTPISMAEQPKAVAMDLAARIEAALAEPDALLDMEGDRNDRLAEEQLLPDVDYLVEESALPELEPIPVEEMAGIEPMDGEKLSTLETIAVQGMMEAERAASGERPAFIFPASEQEPGEEEMRDEDFERAFLSPSEGPLQPLEAPELPPVDQEMLDTGRATTADHFAIWDFTGDLDQLVPPAIQEESFERRPSQTMRSEPAGMSNRSTWPREPSRSDAAGQVGQTVVGRPLDEKNRTAERREPQTSQPERSEVTSTSPGRPSPAIKAQQQEAGAKEVTPPPVFSRERPSSGMTEAAPGPSPLFEETPPPTTGKRGRSFFYNEEGVSREEAITPVGLPVVYDLAKPIEDSGPEQNQEDTEQPALGSEGEKRFSRSGSGVQPAPGGGEEQTTRSGERYVRWTGLQTGQSRVPPTGKEGQGQPEE